MRSHCAGDGEQADIQLYFNPVTCTTAPRGKRPLINPDPFAGFIASFQPCRPTSRGRIDIVSPQATDAPAIAPNSLSTDQDIETVLAGARIIQSLMRARTMQPLIDRVMLPDILNLDDAAIIDDFRRRCGTVFHPVATCTMGQTEASSVVDLHLRVHGFERLRVVDASAFPNITSGNTNAPTIMLAHRAAGLILENRF